MDLFPSLSGPAPWKFVAATEKLGTLRTFWAALIQEDAQVRKVLCVLFETN